METRTFIRKKTVLAFAVVAAVLLVMSVVLGVFMLARRTGDLWIALGVLLLLAVFFALIAWIEYRGSLVVEEESIRFNYSVFSDDRELNGKKLRLRCDQVDHVKRTLQEGDGVMIRDSAVYQFVLKDGRRFLTFFNHFGVETEKEIVDLLSRKFRFE